MILSFANKSVERNDFNDDSLKVDTINEIEELLSKQRKNESFNQILDIDNILNTNAERIFLQNVSSQNVKSNNNSLSKSSKSNHKRSGSKLSDYLKNGVLDYSLDSNSEKSKEEQDNKNGGKNKKHKKKKNFVLKSELFSSFESDKNNKSEKAASNPSML